MVLAAAFEDASFTGHCANKRSPRSSKLIGDFERRQ